MSAEPRTPSHTAVWRFELRFFTEQRLFLYGSTAAASNVIGLGWLLTHHRWLNPDGAPCTDFIWIWLTSKFALSGVLTQAYDYSALLATRGALVGGPNCVLEHFDYPPTLLLFTFPLGSMPFSTAFAVWIAATLLLYLAAVYSITRRTAAVVLALTPFPVIFNILMGHNGFLTAGLMGLSLTFIQRWPRVAGILLGLLTYKPQLGILFPFALLASRNWRALVTATAATVLVALASAIAFGYQTWPSFIDALVGRASSLTNSPDAAAALVSVFGFLRSLGMRPLISWSAQLVVSAGVAVLVCTLWARPIPLSLKAAALCIASLLAAPHAHGYDACILSVAVAFLVKDGLERGFLVGERAVMLMCWLGLILLTGPIPDIICVVLLVLVMRRTVLSQKRLDHGTEIGRLEPLLGIRAVRLPP